VSYLGLEKPGAAGPILVEAKQLKPVDPKEVLTDLLELLEEYGPSWYTEEHQARVAAALRVLK
jgi:hypothetical protein